jgi:hypothetical protein
VGPSRSRILALLAALAVAVTLVGGLVLPRLGAAGAADIVVVPQATVVRIERRGGTAPPGCRPPVRVGW